MPIALRECWMKSVSECERARQLDPLVKSNGSVLNTYLYLGEYDKFLQSLPEASDSSFILFYRGFGEYHQKNWGQAAKDFDRAYKLDPTLYASIGTAFSDAIAHNELDGLRILRKLESEVQQRGVGDPEATYKMAQAYSVLGDRASAIRTLRKSIEDGFFSYPYFVKDPLLSNLRPEPEFSELMKTARLRCDAFKDRFFRISGG